MKKLLCSALFALAFVASTRADTALVFNEIMYHPPFQNNEVAEAYHEWIELYNQLAVDLDVSGWRISGDINFTFPNGTRVPGRSFIIIAHDPATFTLETGITNVFGPVTNRLSNSGGTLRIRNNSDRVVDEINYGVDGDWPVTPDGSGVSLAKRDRDFGSADAKNWTQSAEIGGTPGRDNFSVASNVRLIAVDTGWKYEASGTDLGTAWRGPGFNDSAWSSRHNLTNLSVPTLFNTGVGNNRAVLANNTPDPHYIITANAQGGTGTNALAILNHPNWLANDATSSFIGIHNPGSDNVAAGVYSYRTGFSLDGFIPSTVQINLFVAVDNNLDNVLLNGVPTGLATSGFGAFNGPFLLNSSGFLAGSNTLEFQTFNLDGPGANPHGFRAQFTSSGLSQNTNGPLPAGNSTYYFRKGFNFAGDPRYTTLTLNPVVTDGAVFYLNGVEIYRQNMPAGPVSYSTPAISNVSTIAYSGPITISGSNLVAGANVLAVEVHQASGSLDGPLLGTELAFSSQPASPVPVAFNEIAGGTNPAAFWIELANYGSNPIALDGYVVSLDPAGIPSFPYTISNGVTLPPGGFLTITNFDPPFVYLTFSGMRVFLFTSNRTAVLDGAVVKNGPRGRYPDGTGAWLVPGAPTPDTNNAFTFHNEIVINEIMYHHKNFPPVATNIPPRENPEAWIELYNRSSNTVDLSDWELAGGISYKFNLGKTIAPGAYLIVADDQDQMRAAYPTLDIVGSLGGRLSHNNDRIVLKDPLGNPADEVHYYGGGRWPLFADGGGSSLELRDPNADNSKPEAWAASDESGKSSWQTYTYRGVANIPAGSGQPTTWNDFVFGLLAEGECLIDDISVVESPSGTPVQFINNGNFESGATGWRLLGTHGHSEVVVDPDSPGNHVLHLVATGPQEHMHNHIETTYISGRTVTAGREYQISYRAKWLSGNNFLNTRLYFNRVGRSIPLTYPHLNGTPGAPNSRFVPNIGPTFSDFGHQPVVPSPGAPVTVSVTAQDPNGVSSASLFWSVNSGPWNSAAMTAGGNGRFTGTIPGQGAGTVVQFYVQATDGLSATATFPARAALSGALYKVDDGQANIPLAHNVRIILTTSNIDFIHGTAQGVNQTNVMSNDLFPCTVVYDERIVYYDCGVHLRGSQRGRYSDVRTGFHIEFAPDDLFRGVHPVMLIDRSGAGDATANRQEEIVLKHILNRAGGIPGTYSEICRLLAPRAAHNGPAQFFPRHEDVFIETLYPNGGDGTMFEMELIYYPTTANAAGYKNPQPDGVVGTDITDLTSDKEFYRYNFMIKNHRNEDDYNRFIALGKAWALPAGPALDAQTRQLMDMDQWMRAYALVSLCSVGDMYTFGNNHNFFMYVRPSDGKFLYFPWDMDFAFTRGAGGALVGDQNLGKIVNMPANLRCLYAHMLDIINVSFNANYMTYWTAHYASFAPGQSYANSLSTIAARAPSVVSTINGQGGNAPFAIGGTNFIVTGNNLITLSGTAPVTIKTITVNGVEYPITWSTIGSWTMSFPVSSATNDIVIEGHNLSGTVVSNLTRTIVFTNALPDPAGTIVFNEIMYNPISPDAAYIELFNTASNASFDLSGWRINGLDFTFPAGSIITSRQYLIIAANAVAYTAAYGTNAGVPIAQFAGNLQNDGETLTLIKPAANSNEVDVVVDKVRYESSVPWPNANGIGPSLQVIDPNQDNSRVANWATLPLVNDGWRFVSVTGSSAAGIGGGQMRLMIYLGTELGSAIIDDISVVAGSVPNVGQNYVRNGDFESSPLLENPPLTNSWSVGTNYTNTVIISDLVHSGSGALKLVASTFGNSFPRIISQNLSPAPAQNATHTMSFWFWSTNSGTNLNIRLQNSAQINVVTNINIVTNSVNGLASPGLANQVATNLPAFPPLWINEVLAENVTGVLDNNGEREPWIEIFNASTNTVSLDGLYLANNYTNLTQWAFPPGSSIGPTQFLVVFADGEANESSGGEYHTGFRLAAGSGSVALSRIYNGAPQVLDYINYAGLHADKSFGSYPDGQPFERFEFFYVTPRSANDGRSGPITVFINEWMAGNTSSLADPADGDFDDWFELYNPTTNTVDLAGYFLTDVLTNKTKYLITTNGPHTIAPQGYLLVWADNETGQNVSGGVPRADRHVNFQLAQAAEAIGLFAPDGTQIDAITFSNQVDNVSEGRCPDGGAAIVAMTNSTPRSPNACSTGGNTAPVLGAIGNKGAYVGQALTFTATATDADAGQQLTYTLDAGAPSGATINPNSGAFNWTPSAVGNVNITLRVTDNGAPPLSDFETIAVQVTAGPGFTSTVRRGSNMEMTWSTLPGKKYAVDFATSLTTPITWTPIVTNTAPGNTLSYTNATTGPQRFFRTRVVE